MTKPTPAPKTRVRVAKAAPAAITEPQAQRVSAKILMQTELHPYLAFAIILVASFSVVLATLISTQNMAYGEPQTIIPHQSKSKLTPGEQLYYGLGPAASSTSASSGILDNDPAIQILVPAASNAWGGNDDDIPVVIFPEYSQNPENVPGKDSAYGYYSESEPAPDYTIGSLTMTPLKPTVGQLATVTWTVKNSGKKAGEYPGFSIDYGPHPPVSVAIIKNTCTPKKVLAAGASCETQLQVIYSWAGVQSLIVKASQSKTYFPESNFNNNWRQISFVVSQ